METKEPEILILTLLDRQDSDIVLEGSAEIGMPVSRDCPSRRKILNTDHILKGEDLIPIRYISGCPTIIREEQESRGYRPNPQMDAIWFEEGGTMTIVKTPQTKALFNFMKTSPRNRDAPNRPSNATAIYGEIKKQEIARDTLELQEAQLIAKAMVFSLRTKSTGKKGGHEYDVNRINFLSLLFGVVGADTPEEKMAVLLSIAEARPEFFNEKLDSSTAEIRGEVLMAQQLSVLMIDKGVASFPSNQHVIFQSRSRSKEAQLDELITFFLTEDGAPQYQFMLEQLELAKQQAANQQ